MAYESRLRLYRLAKTSKLIWQQRVDAIALGELTIPVFVFTFLFRKKFGRIVDFLIARRNRLITFGDQHLQMEDMSRLPVEGRVACLEQPIEAQHLADVVRRAPAFAILGVRKQRHVRRRGRKCFWLLSR
jgi:hypothetical protein